MEEKLFNPVNMLPVPTPAVQYSSIEYIASTMRRELKKKPKEHTASGLFSLSPNRVKKSEK